jgi:hypothetical protein
MFGPPVGTPSPVRTRVVTARSFALVPAEHDPNQEEEPNMAVDLSNVGWQHEKFVFTIPQGAIIPVVQTLVAAGFHSFHVTPMHPVVAQLVQNAEALPAEISVIPDKGQRLTFLNVVQQIANGLGVQEIVLRREKISFQPVQIGVQPLV